MKSKTIVLAVLFGVSFLVASNINVKSLKADDPCQYFFGPGCTGYECPPGTTKGEASLYYCDYVICQPGSFEIPCYGKQLICKESSFSKRVDLSTSEKMINFIKKYNFHENFFLQIIVFKEDTMKSKTIVLAVLFSVSFLVASNINVSSLKANPCEYFYGPHCNGDECAPGTTIYEASPFYCDYVICQPGHFGITCYSNQLIKYDSINQVGSLLPQLRLDLIQMSTA